MDQQLITTSTGLEGYKVTAHLGIVRGISVRSRNVVANFAGAFQTLLGGHLSIYSELCERARKESFDKMLEQAALLQANAILSLRYDANEIMSGVTEVLCYGTAVCVEKIEPTI